MVQVVKLIETFLHWVARQVVNDTEVDLTLDNTVLRVKDDLLDHLSWGQISHLLTYAVRE